MNESVKRWAAEADRLESLGDNCEFGFVCRKLGFENASLFRWAWMKPKGLLALLLNDFRHGYDFENLSPYRTNMVREDIYDISWHTKMKVAYRGQAFEFVYVLDTRQNLFMQEARKFAYLRAKFVSRVEAGGGLYFIKSNDGIAPHILSAIHGEMLRLAKGAPFWLIHVCLAGAEDEVGSVRGVGANGLLEARVRRFASYNEADDVDLPVWEEIIDKVFLAARYEEWPQARRASEKALARSVRRLPLAACDGDAAEYGRFSSITDHAWSRKLEDNNVFRLHCSGADESKSMLLWSDIAVDGRSLMTLAARVAVDDSKVVRVSATLRDARNAIMTEVFVGRELSASFELASKAAGPFTLEIGASTPESLKGGDRAVIDVDAPEIRLLGAEV
jgi:hypothetical protein